MGDEGWGQYIKDSVIGEQCWAAGLAYTESGEIFDVAADDDDGWKYLYKEEHQEEHDGKPVSINETNNLLEVIGSGKASTGLWLGGEKYQIVRNDTMPFKDNSEYPVVLFAKGKRGGAIVVGPTYSVIGLYDEEKEQTKNGCVGILLEFCHAIKDM